MKEVRIFLLDLNPASPVGSKLRSILESSADPRVQLLQEIGGVGPGLGHKILHSNVDLIFLVLSAQNLEQVYFLVNSLGGEKFEIPTMAIFEDGNPEKMIRLLKLGVIDFITPPLKTADVLSRIGRVLKEKSPDEVLVQKITKMIGLQNLVGNSPAFLAEINKIPLAAECDVSVLISGETGTGKEVCARAIHYLSRRAEKPFVPLSCGAIPVDLIENELFGHAREAFTGAASSKGGLIHEADGGTLFLDDIDCLPLSAQAKMLRFIQEKEYRPLGSTRVHRADVRITASTNLDLAKGVLEGRFRRDLFYRLDIVHFHLPPIRERKEDLMPLARYFLDKYAKELNRQVKDFTPRAFQKLMNYSWPGNVRELENVVQRAMIFLWPNYSVAVESQLFSLLIYIQPAAKKFLRYPLSTA